MIEIIKKGTKKTCTCKKCGCYFSFEEEDITILPFNGAGYRPSTKYLKCPQCKGRIDLETRK